jgi:hypothetical protein
MKSTKSSKSAAAPKPRLDAKTAALRAKRLERDARAQAPSRPTTPPAKPEPKHGVGYHIRKIVIQAFPAELTNEAIDAALVAASITGTKRSTISTAKQDCLNTLKVAQELGKLTASTVPATPTVAAARSSADSAQSEAVLAS